MKLGLGTEGYSPAVLRRAVRQAGKAPSFKEASADMLELCFVKIGPSHIGKLAERIGREWVATRDADVQTFREDKLTAQYAEAPKVATVMVDGGTVQTRDDESGNGVTDPGWHEAKVACCQSMWSKVHAIDPQPEPPKKFLDRIAVARLAAEMKGRSTKASTRATKEQGGCQAEAVQEGKEGGQATETGANGDRQHGQQRRLRLAGGRRGAASRPGQGGP